MANLKTKRLWDEAWSKLSNFFFTPSAFVESPFGAGPVEITEPLTLYVETTGNDGNPGTADRPFATIQAAFNSLLSKSLLAKVTILVGAGSFSAFSIDYNLLKMPFGSVNSDNNYGVNIEGTLVPATLTTGTTTGNVGASGSAVVDLAGVLTDATQTWTVDQLKGKFIRFGGLANSVYPIISNTATTLTYAINGTFNNTAYEILEHGTNIDTGSVTPFASSITADQFRVILANAPNFRTTNTNEVRFLNITSPSGTNAKAVLLYGTVAMASCRLYKSAVASTPAIHMSGIRPTLLRSVVQVEATNAIGIQATGELIGGIVNSCLVNTNSTNNTLGINTLNANTPSVLNLSSTTIYGFATGLTASCPAQINGGQALRFLNCTTAISIGGQTNIHHSSAAVIGYFNTCGTIASIAGPFFLHLATGTTGVTNTNGVVATQGARCKIAATTTLGATNELSVDGVAGTLATMRGNSPKVFPLTPNAYGTYIYE